MRSLQGITFIKIMLFTVEDKRARRKVTSVLSSRKPSALESASQDGWLKPWNLDAPIWRLNHTFMYNVLWFPKWVGRVTQVTVKSRKLPQP